MLLRLTYLGGTNAFALLRLLAMNDQNKDIDVLVLRHQLTVLQRQLSPHKELGGDRRIAAGQRR